MPGTDYDWDAPTKLQDPGVNGSTVPLPYGLDPARVPLAGTYVEGPQQQSTLTSAWYRAAATRRRPSAGGRHRGGHHRGQQRAQRAHRRADRRTGVRAAGPRRCAGARGPAGALRPRAASRRGATCASRASQIPADAVAVRVVAEDLSLTPGDWIAVTPPRVPELRSVQEYVGSQQPVLMDWAVGLAFPCQQPMLHANGVTEVPKFRITPDYTAKKQDTDTWQDGLNGGLLGITDLLLRAHVMATYLSRDWGRDWGSLRKFDTIVDAQPAQTSTWAPPRAAGCGSPARSASDPKWQNTSGAYTRYITPVSNV